MSVWSSNVCQAPSSCKQAEWLAAAIVKGTPRSEIIARRSQLALAAPFATHATHGVLVASPIPTFAPNRPHRQWGAGSANSAAHRAVLSASAPHFAIQFMTFFAARAGSRRRAKRVGCGMGGQGLDP